MRHAKQPRGPLSTDLSPLCIKHALRGKACLLILLTIRASTLLNLAYNTLTPYKFFVLLTSFMHNPVQSRVRVIESTNALYKQGMATNVQTREHARRSSLRASSLNAGALLLTAFVNAGTSSHAH
jgi:hypothetical protein